MIEAGPRLRYIRYTIAGAYFCIGIPCSGVGAALRHAFRTSTVISGSKVVSTPDHNSCRHSIFELDHMNTNSLRKVSCTAGGYFFNSKKRTVLSSENTEQ